MPADSGTPTEWLDDPSHEIVNVHCTCELELAASRFLQRQRHPRHLDRESSIETVVESLRELTRLPLPTIGRRIDLDTSKQPDLTDLVRAIRDELKLVT